MEKPLTCLLKDLCEGPAGDPPVPLMCPFPLTSRLTEFPKHTVSLSEGPQEGHGQPGAFLGQRNGSWPVLLPRQELKAQYRVVLTPLLTHGKQKTFFLPSFIKIKGRQSLLNTQNPQNYPNQRTNTCRVH